MSRLVDFQAVADHKSHRRCDLGRSSQYSHPSNVFSIIFLFSHMIGANLGIQRRIPYRCPQTFASLQIRNGPLTCRVVSQDPSPECCRRLDCGGTSSSQSLLHQRVQPQALDAEKIGRGFHPCVRENGTSELNIAVDRHRESRIEDVRVECRHEKGSELPIDRRCRRKSLYAP